MPLLSTLLHLLEAVEAGGIYLARFPALPWSALLVNGLLYLLSVQLGYPTLSAAFIAGLGTVAFYCE